MYFLSDYAYGERVREEQHSSLSKFIERLTRYGVPEDKWSDGSYGWPGSNSEHRVTFTPVGSARDVAPPIVQDPLTIMRGSPLWDALAPAFANPDTRKVTLHLWDGAKVKIGEGMWTPPLELGEGR